MSVRTARASLPLWTFKGIKGKLTGTGTVDIKTTVVTLDITGTASY